MSTLLPAPALSSSPLHWATTNSFFFLPLNFAVNLPFVAAVTVSCFQLGSLALRLATTICSPPSGGESLPTTFTFFFFPFEDLPFGTSRVSLDGSPAWPPVVVAK